MPDERITFNEITELLSNPDTIQSDLMEAYEMMWGHLHKKYTNKMISMFESYQTNTKKNPPPEVKLLKAWKPFVPEESHGRINEFVEMLNTMNAIKEIKSGMDEAFAGIHNEGSGYSKADVVAAASTANSSVHHDGVYDIDENCYVNNYGGGFGGDGMAGLLMLFAFMNR